MQLSKNYGCGLFPCKDEIRCPQHIYNQVNIYFCTAFQMLSMYKSNHSESIVSPRNPALTAYLQQEFIFETDIKNKDRILLQKKYALNSHRFYR